MSLLKAIAVQQVDEAGFINALKGMVGKKPEQQQQQASPDTHRTSGADTDPALKRIATQLSDSGDSLKIAVDIDRSGLVNKYLQKGGDAALASDTELFPEQKIDALAKELAAAKNKHNPRIWPAVNAADRVMLFSVPKSVVQNFLKITGTTDEDKANRRKALAMVIAHKYYQMTLKRVEALKLFNSIEASAKQMGLDPMSFDALEELFNPYVIENHPNGILKAARAQWDEKQREKQEAPEKEKEEQINKLETDAERAERIRNAEKRKAGGAESESLETAVLNQYLLNFDKEPADIAAIMSKHFEKVKDIASIQNMVNELGKKYPATKLSDVAMNFKKPADNTGQNTQEQ